MLESFQAQNRCMHSTANLFKEEEKGKELKKTPKTVTVYFR